MRAANVNQNPASRPLKLSKGLGCFLSTVCWIVMTTDDPIAAPSCRPELQMAPVTPDWDDGAEAMMATFAAMNMKTFPMVPMIKPGKIKGQ